MLGKNNFSLIFNSYNSLIFKISVLIWSNSIRKYRKSYFSLPDFSKWCVVVEALGNFAVPYRSSSLVVFELHAVGLPIEQRPVRTMVAVEDAVALVAEPMVTA